MAYDSVTTRPETSRGRGSNLADPNFCIVGHVHSGNIGGDGGLIRFPTLPSITLVSPFLSIPYLAILMC